MGHYDIELKYILEVPCIYFTNEMLKIMLSKKNVYDTQKCNFLKNNI